LKIKGFILNIIILLLIILVAFLFYSQRTIKPSSDFEKIVVVAHKYIKALEVGDINAMVEYSDDIRYPNKSEQKLNYKEINADIKEAQVLSIIRSSEKEYSLTLSLTTDGRNETIEFPVVDKDNKWTIIVGKE
jgi:uncharacterized lipoprotein YehR (DUF1307 family)